MHRYLFLFFFCSFAIYPQHQEKVDFLDAAIEIRPNLQEKRIDGQVIYTFKVLESVDSVWLDAKNMDFEKIRLNDKGIEWDYDGKRIVIRSKFKKKSSHKLYLEYKCTPKQTVYFIGLDDNNPENDQVWIQGQGKYTSHWLPSFDAMEEKVEFDMDITVDTGFEVIANGILLQRETKDEVSTWQFDMEKPMSSYLLAFVIGEYDKQELMSESGVAIENYFYPEDSLRVEPTYRYTKEIFDFFEEEIGIAYPWQNYKQVPVHDFLYAGMENTGATIFSDAYVIDSTAFIDRNYVNINAHEMAHQWFGNLVTEKDGNHHWLHEGFATYYDYPAEKNLFGADHFYWKLFDTAQQLEELSISGKGESLTDPKASSLTFYEKGAWALVILREEVGEEAFRKGVQSYLQRFAFKNVTVDDFLHEIEIAANKDLNDFKSKWLDSNSFPWEDANDFITRNSSSIRTFSKLKKSLDAYPERFDPIMRLWDGFSSDNLKVALINEFSESFQETNFYEILKTESQTIRQAIAFNSALLNQDENEIFQSFLGDKSYVTQEHALFKLWEAFPEERVGYLNELQNVMGLPNKNVRLLWLTLALVTPNIIPLKKKCIWMNWFTIPIPNTIQKFVKGLFSIYIKSMA
ncbi:M1 family metallopeptidase [Maribacter litopenaei]|uniref:Aminopeptidase N n=1 Tax=Maribacter litopenaei TaxID=2976127 RepID=A0ABY5YDL4_9FLAO|nr:M1 family metallopeptidase [Maribacter litopenaei]UWX56210.1 M1 family metallopeptidase [Maribacter litopenaei]